MTVSVAPSSRGVSAAASSRTARATGWRLGSGRRCIMRRQLPRDVVKYVYNLRPKRGDSPHGHCHHQRDDQAIFHHTLTAADFPPTSVHLDPPSLPCVYAISFTCAACDCQSRWKTRGASIDTFFHADNNKGISGGHTGALVTALPPETCDVTRIREDALRSLV